MALGHAFLHEMFGATPRVGWQLDPFGRLGSPARVLVELS